MKRIFFRLLITLVVLLGVFSLISLFKQENSPDMTMGISFPPSAKVEFVKSVAAANADFLYIRVTLDSASFTQLISEYPFSEVSQELGSNPFLGIPETFEGWHPHGAEVGIGGMLNLREGKTMVYFFDTRIPGKIYGWLLIGR